MYIPILLSWVTVAKLQSSSLCLIGEDGRIEGEKCSSVSGDYVFFVCNELANVKSFLSS